MAIPSKQIGWSQESNLLWEILKQTNKLSGLLTPPAPVVPKYKVFTALLTQNGASNPQSITGGDLTIGVTYTIAEDSEGDYDFTNVGAPNNNWLTSFVATGTTPNSWGTAAQLNFNTGAPVATILENTIGNIWFTYIDPGVFYIKSDGLFLQDKTYISVQLCGEDQYAPLIGVVKYETDSNLYLYAQSPFGDTYNGPIFPGQYSSIEIRIYN